MAMKLLSYVRSLTARFLHRTQVEDEMAEELRSHIQHRADDLERSGVDRAEAERLASVEFGGQERFKEEIHEALGGNLIDGLMNDLRYAAAGCASLAALPRWQWLRSRWASARTPWFSQ
jgi:hypothetical protein